MIILICGLPRAGKTTYSKKYEQDMIVFHLDTYGMIEGSRYLGIFHSVYQNSNKNIVIDGVFHSAHLRKRLLQSYKNNDKRICIWINTPLEIRKSRSGYVKYYADFEPPTYDEGWDEIIVIKGDAYG